jgi:integration host factor subunit beta
MNKAELIETLKDKNEFTREQADRVVNLFFNEMMRTLANGERVEIRGFGSFSVRRYRAYKGRNPRTGTTIKVDNKKLPFFRCGKELKERADFA